MNLTFFTGGDKRAYFMGQKAVDKIMESKFATQNAKDSDKPTIPDREHAVAMMNFFMRLGLFYRGERVICFRIALLRNCWF